MTYVKTSGTEVKPCYTSSATGDIEIPETVESPCGGTYTVTAIGEGAFQYCNGLTSVTIPNSVTTIGSDAFRACIGLTSVTIPNSVTTIGSLAFYNCQNLATVTFEENSSVSRIGEYAFSSCIKLTSIEIPNSVTNVGVGAFKDCSMLTSVTCFREEAVTLTNTDSVFSNTHDTITLTVPFGSNYSSWESATDWQAVNYKINQGETKTLSTTFEITNENKRAIINQGVLRIAQGGQLINETETNVSGVIEVETPTLPTDKWSFIGAPFNGYKLEAVKPGTKDISVSMFDYTTGAWSTGANEWATIEDIVGAGEGFFAWSFAPEPTTFTTQGENTTYSLNNADVTVTKPLTSNNGNWMALANPYPFKLDIDKFITTNQANIQGQDGIYTLDANGAFQYVTEGTLNVTEGFFVNFASAGNQTATFKKTQGVNYPQPQDPAKSTAKRDFIRLAMVDGENEVELLFAHNEKAKDEYDIFDANKLFSPSEITEHYFVTNDTPLVKEEAKALPYTATMNVRSKESKEVTFRISNLPQGMEVTIIDGEQSIKIDENTSYTTNIIAGENADRFKVVFGNNREMTESTNSEITITNNNRNINISTQEKDLQIEVYNALGQKVYETKDYNFTLNEVSAGAYVIKTFNKSTNKSEKVVIK